MSYDLEYFTEFLEDPSAPSLAEFYRMVGAWGTYIGEHKSDFNYLVDDEWKEIRERLIAEFNVRQAIKREIDDEWEALVEEGDNVGELSDEEAIGFCRRRLNFMKTHQEFYEFPNEEIALSEEWLIDFEKAYQKNLVTQEELRISEIELEESLAKLDEEMIKIYERTGKFPRVQFYAGLKKYKGN